MSEIIDKAKALMDTYEQLLAQTRAERTALAADNERLRSVLVWLDRIGGLGLDVHARITEALAATPAQSLAAHDAAVKVAVLREVADREFNPEQSAEERWAHGVLYGNADRIEKEAQRG